MSFIIRHASFQRLCESSTTIGVSEVYRLLVRFYIEQTSQNCQLTRFSFLARAHRRLDRDGFPKISPTFSSAHASSLCSLRLGCFVSSLGFKQLFVSACFIVLVYLSLSFESLKSWHAGRFRNFAKPCRRF